jgi:hypothetical protein
MEKALLSMINRQFNQVIKFFSPTGDYIGMIHNNVEGTGKVNSELRAKLLGGLDSFKFTISKEFKIPFYNLMRTEFWFFGYHWYTGEMEVKPDQDRRDVKFSYKGRGYWQYLKKISVDKLYQNKTIKEILIDLIANEIAPSTPILYDATLINPPNINILKKEWKNKKVDKIITELLGIANKDYNTQQYRWGINKDLKFFFEPVSNNLQRTFFEGFQYQNPDVNTEIGKIINKILIYRAIEGTNDTEFVSSIEDGNSIGLFDERSEDLIISDFADTTTAENIAKEKIEIFKEPITAIKVNNLIPEQQPFTPGFYKLVNKKDRYVKVISEAESLDDWTLSLTKTSVTVSTEKVLTGKKAFKVITASGGKGDFIELILDDPIYYPTQLRFYVSQDKFGNAINIQAFDTEGNTFGTEEGLLLKEDGGQILLENGTDSLALEPGGLALTLLLENDYQRQVFDIDNLRNIERLRINFNTQEFGIIIEENNTPTGVLVKEEDNADWILQEGDKQYLLYLDRFEVQTKSYKANTIIFNEITYDFNDNNLISSAKFGKKVTSAVSSIKTLSDKQKNIANIFQKS